MAKTLTPIEEARATVARLEGRRAELTGRLSTAEERRGRAADDVDALVEIAREADACRSAVKHIDGELAAARAKLATLADKERREELAELAREIDAFIEDIVERVHAVYMRATNDGMAEVVRKHDALAVELAGGPYTVTKTRELAQLQQLLEGVLMGTGRYTVLQHAPHDGPPRREVRRIVADA